MSGRKPYSHLNSNRKSHDLIYQAKRRAQRQVIELQELRQQEINASEYAYLQTVKAEYEHVVKLIDVNLQGYIKSTNKCPPNTPSS